MSENEAGHVCDEEGCTLTKTQQYFFPFPVDGESEDMWLCDEHVIDSGFCLWCHWFGAGSEDFDFSPMKGYHRECYDELRYECGETDDDDDEWDHDWDFYGKGWYDPDVPVPDDEDDPLIYIGPDVS